jgi:uncharacterized protein (TIGR02444 family)
MNAGDSALWQFSLRFYRRPEVPALCLHLQDAHGVDINLLFFISFLAINGQQLTVDEVRRIDHSMRDWRGHVVQPLRAIRRALKGGIAPVDSDAAAALRDAIKRDELQAERLQQEALARAFPIGSLGKAALPRAAAAANIAAYNSMFNGGLDVESVNALLASLTAEFSL